MTLVARPGLFGLGRCFGARGSTSKIESWTANPLPRLGTLGRGTEDPHGTSGRLGTPNLAQRLLEGPKGLEARSGDSTRRRTEKVEWGPGNVTTSGRTFRESRRHRDRGGRDEEVQRRGSQQRVGVRSGRGSVGGQTIRRTQRLRREAFLQGVTFRSQDLRGDHTLATEGVSPVSPKRVV